MKDIVINVGMLFHISDEEFEKLVKQRNRRGDVIIYDMTLIKELMDNKDYILKSPAMIMSETFHYCSGLERLKYDK